MGKLTHIDDDSDEMAAAQELIAAQRQDGAPASSPAREPEPATAPEPQPTRKDEAPEQAEAQRRPDAPGPSRHARFQPIERIQEDTQKDNFMDPQEAKAYGLIDDVVKSRAASAAEKKE